jgi:tetratricopeptide (TPR) repeat protein
MGSAFKDAQTLLDRAIESTGLGRFGEAGKHFLEALKIIEAWPDGPDRSRQLGLTAHLCSSAGHPDLALMALQGLLESRERSRHPAQRCADLLTLANSWSRLGRPTASAVVNEAALAHALAHQRFADAASAQTNLAINDANSGRLPEALKRLQESLKLLSNGSNPDTDAITRLSLLQVVDAMQAEPEIALGVSADLFGRLERHVGPERWKVAAPAFHRLVDRYLAAHPELDAEAWRRKTFPLVFKEEPT